MWYCYIEMGFGHVFHGLQVFVSVKFCKGLYRTKSANAAAVLCIESPILTHMCVQLRTLMESLEAANVEEQKSTRQHPTTSTELKDEIVAGPIDSSTKLATKMTAQGKSRG